MEILKEKPKPKPKPICAWVGLALVEVVGGCHKCHAIDPFNSFFENPRVILKVVKSGIFY